MLGTFSVLNVQTPGPGFRVNENPCPAHPPWGPRDHCSCRSLRVSGDVCVHHKPSVRVTWSPLKCRLLGHTLNYQHWEWGPDICISQISQCECDTQKCENYCLPQAEGSMCAEHLSPFFPVPARFFLPSSLNWEAEFQMSTCFSHPQQWVQA